MTTKTVNLYTFNELTPSAKEKAREWWRECEAQTFGSFGDLTEPAETVAKILGISFKTHSVRTMGGKDRYEPNIWWLLEARGQGASFEGTYSYAKGSAKTIASEFPTDTELNRIARELANLQKKYAYRLGCVITADRRSVHKYGMEVELENYGDGVKEDDAATLLELMRDFADWIFKGLQEEWEYRMSDDNVDDSIEANEYTFTSDGSRED
jgi:hypothetical protein